MLTRKSLSPPPFLMEMSSRPSLLPPEGLTELRRAFFSFLLTSFFSFLSNCDRAVWSLRIFSRKGGKKRKKLEDNHPPTGVEIIKITRAGKR